jgi:hypothetical protein
MSASEDLRHFWWRAEELEPVFAAEEVKRWPATFERLRHCGLLRETELASSVMCYNCGRPHPEEVIYLNEDLLGRTRPHIVCPDEGLIEIDIDDMRQWLVDRQTLLRMLAAALEAAGHIEQMVPNRVWSLGRRHLGGRFRNFFFVAGAARPDGPAVMPMRTGSETWPLLSSWFRVSRQAMSNGRTPHCRYSACPRWRNSVKAGSSWIWTTSRTLCRATGFLHLRKPSAAFHSQTARSGKILRWKSPTGHSWPL